MPIPRATVHRLGDRIRAAITDALAGAAEALEGAARAQLERTGPSLPSMSPTVLVAHAAARLVQRYGYELVYVERRAMSDEIEVVARHLCGQRRVVRIPDEAVLAADKSVAEAFFDALAASFSKSCSACGRELT